MRNLESWWASLIYVFDLATFSTGTDKSVAPQTIVGGPVFRPPVEDAEWHLRFRPPGPRSDGLPEPIECDYSAMGKGWEPCHGPDGGCWLKGPNGKGFNITTDYENESPKGITRRYSLDITSQALAPDGVPMAHGKVFNNSYPGPWIQACWGDELEITVRNHLRYNGTTIHWHGIRMGNNSENDGVNGVTQCPIAPNQEMTYKFKTTQYGTSWYHSHYSLQYADGLVGPLTIWGPSSSSYDYAENPILMTDWNHRSAFEDWSYSLQPGNDTPNMTNILLNGQGRDFYKEGDDFKSVHDTKIYTLRVQKGKRHLLRLINTSVDTTFSFEIDDHKLTVIEADFVPIKPYTTNRILIGIGQRYHVILTAIPVKNRRRRRHWISTIPATGCGSENYNTTIGMPVRSGILTYDDEFQGLPQAPTSEPEAKCADEPFDKLIPIFEWNVGQPYNSDVATKHPFEVGLQPVHGKPYHPNYDRLLWNVDQMPLWMNFGDPTILNLYTPNDSWSKHLDVITEDPHAGEWIYLVISAPTELIKGADKNRHFVHAAHPIHLHGHDFALLRQSNETYPGWDGVRNKLTLRNPPRRDVVLLPAGGYIVIAFKADNPGVWLLHCHIAWHASSGLGLQILENTKQLSERLLNKTVSNPVIQAGIVDTCNEWDNWYRDTRNHYDPRHSWAFQDDSGV